MWWLIPLGIAVLVFGVIAAWPMRIPREPEREGYQDREAVAAYDRTSRWPVFSLERFIMMRALARRPPQGTIIDLGCGAGYLAARIARRYPARRVIGVDVNSDMLATARRNWSPAEFANLSLVFGDAGRLPLATGSADTIVSSISLHHWQEPLAAFVEIRRVLRPDGVFLLFDVRRDAPRAAYWTLAIGQWFSPPAIRRTNGAVGSFWSAYTVPELIGLLSQAGLGVPRVGRGPVWFLFSVRNVGKM